MSIRKEVEKLREEESAIAQQIIDEMNDKIDEDEKKVESLIDISEKFLEKTNVYGLLDEVNREYVHGKGDKQKYSGSYKYSPREYIDQCVDIERSFPITAYALSWGEDGSNRKSGIFVLAMSGINDGGVKWTIVSTFDILPTSPEEIAAFADGNFKSIEIDSYVHQKPYSKMYAKAQQEIEKSIAKAVFNLINAGEIENT